LSHQPRKRFGQNFLHDPAVIGRIIATINPVFSEQLVEIGPGQGAITLPLLKKAGHLAVVELDRDLVEPLQAKCAALGELTIYNTDALRFDFCRLSGTTPLRIVGNLPYNISTPLLFHLLDQHHCIRDMHFMLQKEVVERMAAPPGNRQYGRLSVMLQQRCEITSLFTIGPGAFTPQPKVESAFVRLVPYAQPPVAVHDAVVFEQLVRQAFAQRRKTLRNALRGTLEAEEISILGIDPAARAETLSVSDFAALANWINSARAE
jgi:16S rRNA (adenine1518-N6/adenine1519-N6)-dimethyltransferase